MNRHANGRRGLIGRVKTAGATPGGCEDHANNGDGRANNCNDFSTHQLIRGFVRIGGSEKLFVTDYVLEDGVMAHLCGQLFGHLERRAAGPTGVELGWRRRRGLGGG